MKVQKLIYNACLPLLALLLLVGCVPLEAIPEPQAATSSSGDSGITVPSATSFDEAMTAKIEAVLMDTMQEYQVPGCALGVAQDGQIVYSQGFGVSEIDTDKSITVQSVFHLASVSKTVTATGIMQLVSEGKIDLDAPVIDYLPYFSLENEPADNITVRQLLSHTAGFPDVEDWMADFASSDSDEEALERQVRSMSGRERLFAPGEDWSYSSAGFNVLGDIIAKVSGQNYEEYVQEHVFTPLGMTLTTSLVNEVDQELLVSPHTKDDEEQIGVNDVYPYSRMHGPSNNLYSNVEEMLHYAMMHLNRGELDGVRILPESAYDDMWSIASDQRDYALGWWISEHGSHRVVNHGGLDFGFNAYLGLIPEESIGLLLACNYAEFGEEFVFPATLAGRSIVDALLNIEE